MMGLFLSSAHHMANRDKDQNVPINKPNFSGLLTLVTKQYTAA
jgi:hypothetical protein